MTTREQETRENTQNKKAGTSNSFLLGAIIGGMVGAAAALLFAPKSGKELRNSINNQTGPLVEKTIQLRENVVNKSNEIVTKTSSLSQGLVQQSTELLNKAKKVTKPNEEYEEKSEIQYIPIHTPAEITTGKHSIKAGTTPDNSDIRKKLEEAKKAFDEEEYKVKH
ncbi:YtxH domain-containing protein [Neobacillus ginsengisoli]|uniref:Gas vesicle protein n=1 Tax=Neobacillus ginsengisoli TaxID=904295 RepID=A0ABT9XN54_9BACI|nr:YtxH domain-containing protein [Neobacillus ginsengisoli]MDQ0196968.1 gas vesicle protein [Neobacillus ginsengisoli]